MPQLHQHYHLNFFHLKHFQKKKDLKLFYTSSDEEKDLVGGKDVFYISRGFAHNIINLCVSETKEAYFVKMNCFFLCARNIKK